jgi:flagellar hook protein FlgE
MSLYGAMMTSISGMNAQVNRLSAVGDNVSNASTAGYKRATASFASMVIDSGSNNYMAGGVVSQVRYSIATQGNIGFSSNSSDLALKGDGFFIVQDATGVQFLTRAGGFQYDSMGNLSSGGFQLVGERIGTPGLMEPIQVDFAAIDANPTQNGSVSANLNVDEPVIATVVNPGPPVTYVNPTPLLNQVDSVYTSKTSLVSFNGVGGSEILDIYYTKTQNHRWEVAVYSQADASATGFPYSAPALGSGYLDFDPIYGRPLGPLAFPVQVPNGLAVNLDFSETTQLASEFNINDATVDGRKASSVERFLFAADGRISALFTSGHIEQTHRLVVASVVSPDKLSVIDGTRFTANADSGPISYGYPSSDRYGSLISGALEGSNVDIAGEFTSMIETQNVYAANSKAFQTGAEMFEVITNLKR